MSYYFNLIDIKKNIGNKKKKVILGFRKLFKFRVGDMLAVSLKYANSAFMFEGICVAIKYGSFKSPNMVISLRSVMESVVVDFMFCFFYNRAFFYKFIDYKRKIKLPFKKNKLFFLKSRL